jgi:hypothetical protein
VASTFKIVGFPSNGGGQTASGAFHAVRREVFPLLNIARSKRTVCLGSEYSIPFGPRLTPGQHLNPQPLPGPPRRRQGTTNRGCARIGAGGRRGLIAIAHYAESMTGFPDLKAFA